MKTLLIAIFFSGSLFAAGSVTLSVMPPAYPLDWSSPSGIFGSIMKNKLTLQKRPLGLVSVGINCPLVNETLDLRPYSFGLIGELLLEGRGLGFLYHTFPGELETLVSEDIKDRTHFFRTLVSDDHCTRIGAYLKEFREKKIARNFGFPHRPLMGEGGNDMSFAVSILEVAGLLDQEQREAWERILYLPDELSGMPLKEKYVSVFSLMGSHWRKDDQKATVLKFWDSAKMTKWIEAQPNVMKDGMAIGIEIDHTKKRAPEGGLWKQSLDIQYQKPSPQNKKTTNP